MIATLIHKNIAYALQIATNFSYTKYWKIKASLLCSVIAVTLSFPDYDLLVYNKANPLAKAIQEGLTHQLQNPFTPIPSKYLHLAEGHLDKRAFRITVPLIAYVLHLDIIGCIILQHVTGMAFYYLLLTAICKFCHDRTLAFLAALGFAATFVGVWSFYDILFFDGIAYFLLLSAMVFRNGWWVGSNVLIASFTDERALVASSFVFIWWLLHDNRDNLFRNKFPSLTHESIAVVFAWVFYLAARYFLGVYFGLHTGKQAVGLNVFRENYPYLAFGVISSVEAFWLLIIAGVVVLIHLKQYVLCVLLVGAILVNQLVGFLVYDITRSVGYVFPSVLIAIFILHKTESKETVRKLVLLTSFLCLLYPTTYITMNIYWMSPVFPKILKYINP